MAEAKKIEIGKAISYGWEAIKKDFWYFFSIAIVVAIISGIGNSHKDGPNTWNLIGLMATAWMTSGYLKIVLSYYDGKKLPFEALFNQLKYFWRILGAIILLSIMFTIGFILLIIPGIYLALRYQFTLSLIIDKDLGVFEAMEQSSKLTDGIKISLLGFALAALGVIILGAIVFGIGVFVAIPITWLAHIYLYKNLHN